MIHVYACSHYAWDVTPRASVSLLLVQPQPLLLGGCPSHWLCLALRPVLAQGWVLGGMPPCALGATGDRDGIGRPPFRLSRPACPRTVVPTIAGLHPLPACVRVSALCPAPAHLPWGISHLVTDVRGRTGPVIMRPSPYDRVACLDFLPCRGVLMCVQIGSQRSHVLEHFCLLWDGPPFALFPAFPAVQPQEVQPFWARHDPGCGFPARQAAGLQELF
jgi:hypothetical protein